jgi:hypothetical protein
MARSFMAQSFAKMSACRAIFCLAAAATCGCARQPDTPKSFVPAPELSRAALEAVLIDWQTGLPPGQIDRLPVTVKVVDQHRKEGQELEEFEILGEAPGSAPRCFAVRLKLRRPEAEEKVRYVVVGINPLWVFRQEDLDGLSHWDHAMPGDPTSDEQSSDIAIQEPIEKESPPPDRQQDSAGRAPASE